MATLLDLCFPVEGDTLPWDHSYALFGALCRKQPGFHQPEHSVGVFPINGVTEGNQRRLDPGSILRLRLPSEQMGESLPLIGATLDLQGARIKLGHPEIHPVPASPRLFASWVTYSKVTDPGTLLERISKEFAKHGITATPRLVAPLKSAAAPTLSQQAAPENNLSVRRTRRIHNVTIVGFALLVENLSPHHSLHLCRHGLGGRRHFGGGLFLPARNR